MNRETRTFIWGIILFFLCGRQVGADIEKIVNHSFVSTTFHWIVFIGSVVASIAGLEKIEKTIN